MNPFELYCKSFIESYPYENNKCKVIKSFAVINNNNDKQIILREGDMFAIHLINENRHLKCFLLDKDLLIDCFILDPYKNVDCYILLEN